MAEFKLTDLVQRVDQDKLVIPDFQRVQVSVPAIHTFG
jgi:hypothetical protein